MGRPPLRVGTWGRIRRVQVEPGLWRAYARYRDIDGRTRQVKASGASGAKAETALIERLEQRRRGGEGDITPETTIEALLVFWLDEVEGTRDLAPDTLAAYRDAVERILAPALGGLRLREVTVSAVDRVIKAERARTAQGSRARIARTVLRQALDVAVRHDALAVNPVAALPRAVRRDHEVVTCRVEDLQAARAAIDAWEARRTTGPRDQVGRLRDVIDLMAATGLRIGEVLALTWDDVDLDADPVTLRVTGTIRKDGSRGAPKTPAARRQVTLPAWGAEILLRRRVAMPAENPAGAVFATRTGTFTTPANLRDDLRRALSPAGLAWITPHVIRRTVATVIAEERDDEAARAQLGHASADVTRQHYIRRSDVVPDMADALERLRP
ncbi:tyrosine-type recombinase/integrase [uncultured Aeromicrobium sp.]|uniref:tyrosine-type recombinase/integrase n=1 Tax=uncultured Aeromicrobium sp. TaxID=337820 RepID=UPI0025FF34D2|nr:tyrosine-type recombinase/integrase [uncultured Aeromicrobium sp.]